MSTRSQFRASAFKSARSSWSRSGGRALACERLESRLLLTHGPTDHIHPVLTIDIEGTTVTIPTNIGITSTRTFHPHTHDTTGTLHIGEGATVGIDAPGSPTRFTTLDDFFDVWRTTGTVGTPQNNPNAFFSSTQILNNVADATHSVEMTVNGVANTEFEAYSPHDLDQIVIRYVEIDPANQQPQANPASSSGLPGAVQSIAMTGEDGDADETQTLSFRVQTLPASGTLRDSNGAVVTVGAALPSAGVTYTPNAGFLGSDSYSFIVVDDGGTDDGGEDTSDPATVTLSVSTNAAPTSLDLIAASDTGVFDDDNQTSDHTPIITLIADPGRTVRLEVNGLEFPVPETAPGQYATELPMGSLQVGTNSIVAVARASDGTDSPDSQPLEIVFAPDLQSQYVVPGELGEEQSIRFHWEARLARFNNEVGVYVVDDETGRVDGIAPGERGYARAVMESASRRVLFTSGQGAGAEIELPAEGGEILGFYLIQNTNSRRFLSQNPTNRMTGGPRAFFSFADANRDHTDHLRAHADPLTGRVEYHWEDLTGGGDRDYNDVVFVVGRHEEAHLNPADTVRVPGAGEEEVHGNFTLLPAVKPGGASNSSAAPIGGELGMFVVDDATGAVEGVGPTADNYLDTVLESETRQTIFSLDAVPGAETELHIEAGALIGFYYIAGGTSQDFLDGEIDAESVFVSLDPANADGQEHIRAFQPDGVGLPAGLASHETLLFHVMDELFGAETEFDDLLFSLDFQAHAHA